MSWLKRIWQILRLWGLNRDIRRCIMLSRPENYPYTEFLLNHRKGKS